MSIQKNKKVWWVVGLGIGLLFSGLALLTGCQGPPGPAGASGASNVATGTISGKITNSLTGASVAGVKITTDPAIDGQTPTTANDGTYSLTLPIGSYKLAAAKPGFTSISDSGTLVAGLKLIKDEVLIPVKPIYINPGTAQSADPGKTVTLKATADPLDGSQVSSFAWSQVSGVAANLSKTSGDTITVTLNNAQAYKDQLVKNLVILDRFKVQGINPHDLIGAQTTTFKVDVTTSSGKYSASVDVTANLPFEFSTGLSDVPLGAPVLLTGKNQPGYNWTMAGPAGSKAEFDQANVRNPVFTPDMVGKYVITETTSKSTLNVYAGTWVGAITGKDAKGNPVAAACMTCHNNTVAPDRFTDWSKSGHASILTQNINDPAGHYTEACVICHSVGYDTAVNNNGFDDAARAEGWKVPAHGDPSNWAKMLTNYPKTAMLANIQCENCHGPNNGSGLHEDGVIDSARVSLSADVCGSCHGEPPRHGRFQQWQESKHGNYQLAIDESGSPSCARCHTAQGFLTWIKQGDLTKQIQGKNGNATADEMKAIVTADTAEPQTCVVCHDPHTQGNTSGEPNTATVRIFGNTLLLPAGFKAEVVGKGAICITCHNTRNGVHNGSIDPTNYQAPHTAAQGDVLMGDNAYFVATDSRSPHSYITDTCVTCHLDETPPPAEYSFQLGGTNHGFVASPAICGKCHSKDLNAAGLQANFKSQIDALGTRLSSSLRNKLPAQFTILEYTPHTYNGKSYDVKSDPLIISKDNILSITLVEPHGQQGYQLTLKNAVTVNYKPAGAAHTLQLTSVQAQLGDFTTDGKTAIVSPTDNLVKAGWNYFLLEGDGSQGVHNPGFESNIINASLAALQ